MCRSMDIYRLIAGRSAGNPLGFRCTDRIGYNWQSDPRLVVRYCPTIWFKFTVRTTLINAGLIPLVDGSASFTTTIDAAELVYGFRASSSIGSVVIELNGHAGHCSLWVSYRSGGSTNLDAISEASDVLSGRLEGSPPKLVIEAHPAARHETERRRPSHSF